MTFFDKPLQTILKVLLLAAIAYGVYLTLTVWLYLLMGIGYGYLLLPLAKRIGHFKVFKRELGNTVGSILALISSITLLFGIMALLIPELIYELGFLSNFDMTSLEQHIADIFTALHGGFDISEWVKEHQDKIVQSTLTGVDSLTSIVGGFLGGATSVLAALFSMFFVSFFIMQDPGLPNRVIARFLPDGVGKWLFPALGNILIMLRRYLVGLSIQMGIFFLMIALGMELIGIPRIFLIAVLAALLNIIPYLGPSLGLLVAIILGFAQMLPLPESFALGTFLLKILGVFAAAQFIDNNLVQPIVFSKSANLHPLEVFVSILVGGSFFGLPGVILAVPAWSAIKIGLDSYQNRAV